MNSNYLRYPYLMGRFFWLIQFADSSIVKNVGGVMKCCKDKMSPEHFSLRSQ